MIKRESIKPLKEFISMGYEAFRKDFIHSNIQGWSLFHFLQHGGDGRYRAGLHKYLAEICSGRSGSSEAFEKHVGELPEVESAYLEYVKTLKVTTKSR